MSQSKRFRFERGNLEKLLAAPKYVLSLVFSWFVPRVKSRWVFGSNAGVGEGALAVANALVRRDPAVNITWLVANEAEAEAALRHGFTPVPRAGRKGFWATLRAGQIVVTHGLGDANRFGVSGGWVIQLWHGAPLKRLHLDSPATTRVSGPAILRKILRKMYLRGANEIDLFVAGSPLAAERLRSAFRLQPGRVRVLGDPRDDVLAQQAVDRSALHAARSSVLEQLESVPQNARVVMYAPTWRDGELDPDLPGEAERAAIERALVAANAHLVIRSHPMGEGTWSEWRSDRVHLLGADKVRDVTPLLGGVDWLITDYSSIAIDFALFGRPVLWFAPDLVEYERTRGLYEPLEVTSGGRIAQTWDTLAERITQLATSQVEHRIAEAETRALAARFHTYPQGGAADRVLDESARLQLPAREQIASPAVFFESYYGRQVSCNPLALDAEIAKRHPEVTRYWSITSENQQVPEGAVPVLVGGRDWSAARRQAKLLVVNDWLRFGFKRARGQIVLQTWHGTMLKHLALGRPGVSLRTRLAVKREARRWSLMLSQNPHSTSQFKENYAFKGEIIEQGYPRCDRLADSVIARGRNPIAVNVARARLGVPQGAKVLVYAPTWRDRGVALVNELGVHELAAELGAGWVVIARGHTRTHAFGSYATGLAGNVIDGSQHDDINDVLLAADLLVTDYSSVMFDASVARVPMAFFAPDLAAYRDRERGFTFDFERRAPGPIVNTRDEVLQLALELAQQGETAPWVQDHAERYDQWRAVFNPHDDGHAAARVVDRLTELGALPA